MEFFNNIIKGLEVILVLYFSLTLNVRLSQSKIKEIISFTLYSGNAANNGIIIDGGRYKINETCELDISNDNEVYLYVTPSGNSTNYVTINTKNIERLSQKKKK